MGDGGQRRVGVLVISQGAERRLDRCRVIHGLDAVECDRAVSERARLVETYDIDAGQALDRRELLYQLFPRGRGHRGPPKSDARKEDETWGNHADDPRHCAADSVADTAVRVELAVE